MMLPAKPLLTAPDDGYNPAFINAWTTDLGEIAARLGSINTMRRTGKAIILDDFSTVDAWIKSGGTSFTISSNPTVRDWGSGKLIPGPLLGNEILRLDRWFPLLSSSRIGIEISYQSQNAVTGETIQFILGKNSASSLVTAELQFVPSTGVLSYQDNTGAFVPAITLGSQAFLKVWANFKIVVDFTTSPGKTAAVYANQLSVFPNTNLFQQAGSVGEFMNLAIRSDDSTLGQNPCYVADLIITVDEP